jgi:general secretion pathway protein A
MYSRYFGLEEPPFSIAPNPRYLFMSDRHREALAHLLYGVSQGGGFVLLTGEVGTGKTTISRCLLEQLPQDTDVAFILNPFLNSLELLATICDELDISYIDDEPTLKDLTDQLHHFLLRNHARGRNTVLIIDEAQHLQFEVLEQVRLLTNLETNTKKLLQIIFIGQPELQDLLAKPALRQLSQRITARFHIDPLTVGETQAYIRHRLQVGGLPGNQEVFSPAIVRQIHAVSGGIPRLINILCDRMLLGSYAQNKARVDSDTFHQAVKEVMGKENGFRRLSVSSLASRWTLPPAWSGALAGFVLVAVVGLALLMSGKDDPAPAVVAEAGKTAGAPVEAPALEGTIDRNRPAPPSEPALAQADSAAVPADVVPAVATAAPPSDAAAAAETAVVPVAAAMPAAPPADPWFNNREKAVNVLLQSLGITTIYSNTPCDDIEQIGLRCELQAVKNWMELKEFNRPSLLVLRTAGGQTGYAALVGMTSTQARLALSDRITEVPLEELGRQWKGEFVFLWHPPADYQRPLAVGDRNAAVAWVALRFAEIDEQRDVLAGDKYNEALAERIKLFQREYRLRDDGIIGVQTLLKLNDRLGIDKTLDTATSDETAKRTAQTNEAG